MRVLCAIAALLAFIASAVLIAEGAGVLRVFINAEALISVAGAAFFLLLASYPAGKILLALKYSFSPELCPDAETAKESLEILSYASDCAVRAGLLVFLSALAVVFFFFESFPQLVRRAALAADIPLFAYFLSRFVLVPLSRRLKAGK